MADKVKKKKPKPKEEKAEPAPCPFVKSTRRRVHRSLVKNAPYNPRTIQPEVLRKLKEKIREVGLVSPPVWNKRTGNLVGGHQRMRAVDLLMGTGDYLIDVDEVDLDDKSERELNIFLNNDESQGDFDMAKLEAMFADDAEVKIDVHKTGFDQGDIYRFFGDSEVIRHDSQAMVELTEKVRAMDAVIKNMAKNVRKRDPRKFFYVIFADDEERAEASKLMNMLDSRYLDGKTLLAFLREHSPYAKGAE